MDQEPYRIGIDLGGTKIETILFGPAGEVRYRERIPTPRGGSDEYGDIRDAVCALIRGTRQRLPASAVHTVGVGIPGTIHPTQHVVQNANTTSLKGRAFQKDLETLLGRPVGMDNDANCFTLAEAVSGAARGYRLVFGLILGTGCGGGLCIDGRIHRGPHLIAGEWGHFSVDPQGAPCWCGNFGCIETKLSGTGVAKAYARKYDERINFEEIVARRRQGEPRAAEIFDQFLEDFGRCVGGLISLLDPDAIVIGGGLSNIEELYGEGVERVRRYAFHERIETPILKNLLGDSAGVYGAAWIGQ
jgi:fructokinase